MFDLTPDEALMVAEGPSTLRDLVACFHERGAETARLQAEVERLRAENERLRGDMRLLLAERLRPPTEEELASVRD